MLATGHKEKTDMFDAWNVVGVGGGSAVLTYLATGPNQTHNGKPTFRLSLDKKSASLVGDVRVLGGLLSGFASMYTKGTTKRTLRVVTAASFLSLVQTEIMRYRVAGAAKGLPIFPAYGATATASHARAQGQPSWAR